MKVYGQLEFAQLENLAADASSTASGYFYFNTVSLFCKYYNGSVWKIFADTNSTQAFTNKDYDGGTASNTSRMTLPSASSATLAGLTRKAGTVVYDTDKTKPYYDNGTTLKPIGSGGSGSGINYVADPSAEDDLSGWGTSGAGVTIARDTTASDLPRESLTPTAILITCVSGTTDYAYYRFQIGDADKAKQMFAGWAQKALSGYAAGDLVLEMWSNSASNYGGSYTQLSVANPDLAAGDYVMGTTWSSTSEDYYEMRVRIASGTGALALCDVTVGPQIPVSVPNSTDWQVYSPTITGFGSVSGTTFEWRVDGVDILVRGTFACGSPTATPNQISLPNDWTARGNNVSGVVVNTVAEAASFYVLCSDGASHVYLTHQAGSLAANAGDSPDGNTIFSPGSGVRVEFRLPVNELSSNVFSSNSAVEYGWNSGTWDADDSTSFAHGQGGSTISGALTAIRTKRLEFRTPIQPSDIFKTQFSDDGIFWFDAGYGNLAGSATESNFFTFTAGLHAGQTLEQVDSTHVDIVFAPIQYLFADGGTSNAWSSGFWRVVKSSNPIGIGHDLVGQNKSGLVASAGQMLGTNALDEADDGNVGQRLTSFNLGYAIGVSNSYEGAVGLDFTGLQPGDFDVYFNGTFNKNGATFLTNIAYELGLSWSTAFPNNSLGKTSALWISPAASNVSYVALSIAGVRVQWDGTDIWVEGVQGSGPLLRGLVYADDFTAGNPQANVGLLGRRVR